MKTYLNSKIYITDIYVRISREDGDKTESDSIVNQKELIKGFIKDKPEFKLNKIRVDDGYSGVNFDRPAFIEMLDNIKSGKVNCVIVKDLSRFGRNYIEAGKYITNIFPFLNVRFIAINDRFDTANIQKNNSELIYVHFKNLMNDAYCNDISLKTRSSLDIKCRNGNFLSAYAPYGYLKSPENKNKIIVDESVRDIVCNIFKWKLSGMSALRIAEKLNNLGIASPMEHKNEVGIKYNSPKKKSFSALWTAKAVSRILQNKIYIGTLEQHKTTTPNYKIKVRVKKPESEWIVNENNHEPIIEKSIFYDVQRLLKEDTRVSPKNNNVYALSGILKCGKCGCNMTRKKVKSGSKEFIYYVCLGNKNKKICDNKTALPVDKLEEIVLQTLNLQIKAFIKIQELADYASRLPRHNTEIQKMQEEIKRNTVAIEQNKNHAVSLYEDLKNGIIDEEDYKALKQMYSDKISSVNIKIESLTREIEIISQKYKYYSDEFEKFVANGEYNRLTREIAVAVIENIFVYDKSHIEIKFKYQDEYKIMQEYSKKLLASEANTAEVM